MEVEQLAVENWLIRLERHLCKTRTMCGFQDKSGKACILYDHCTNRNVFCELIKGQMKRRI